MSSTSRAVLDQALRLSDAERAEIARELIASLDGPPDDHVEQAWAHEVARRLGQIDRGEVVPEDWETVRDRIAAELRSKRG
jgi:putative addiction module component (TIGR02574 family)